MKTMAKTIMASGTTVFKKHGAKLAGIVTTAVIGTAIAQTGSFIAVLAKAQATDLAMMASKEDLAEYMTMYQASKK